MRGWKLLLPCARGVVNRHAVETDLDGEVRGARSASWGRIAVTRDRLHHVQSGCGGSGIAIHLGERDAPGVGWILQGLVIASDGR